VALFVAGVPFGSWRHGRPGSDHSLSPFAGMGTSPAVLTNTVWALAHQKKPVVPSRLRLRRC
jgi:hypothetical protein